MFAAVMVLEPDSPADHHLLQQAHLKRPMPPLRTQRSPLALWRGVPFEGLGTAREKITKISLGLKLIQLYAIGHRARAVAPRVAAQRTSSQLESPGAPVLVVRCPNCSYIRRQSPSLIMQTCCLVCDCGMACLEGQSLTISHPRGCHHQVLPHKPSYLHHNSS